MVIRSRISLHCNPASGKLHSDLDKAPAEMGGQAESNAVTTAEEKQSETSASQTALIDLSLDISVPVRRHLNDMLPPDTISDTQHKPNPTQPELLVALRGIRPLCRFVIWPTSAARSLQYPAQISLLRLALGGSGITDSGLRRGNQCNLIFLEALLSWKGCQLAAIFASWKSNRDDSMHVVFVQESPFAEMLPTSGNLVGSQAEPTP